MVVFTICYHSFCHSLSDRCDLIVFHHHYSKNGEGIYHQKTRTKNSKASTILHWVREVEPTPLHTEDACVPFNRKIIEWLTRKTLCQNFRLLSTHLQLLVSSNLTNERRTKPVILLAFWGNRVKNYAIIL